MRRYLIIGVVFLLSLSLNAQIKWNSAYQTYIDQYKDLAIAEMLKYNIPASITLAQGLLESGAGKSRLARESNNHFGIKCHDWLGSTTYHDDDEKQECFREYRDVFESYEDHSKFLARQPRYRSLFNLKRTDYKGWAKGLKRCGYATSPTYAKQLINIIELYKLYRYDNAKNYDKFMVQRSSVKTHVNSLHPIHIYNKNYYVKVREGDTFRSIADEVGISYKKLAQYNERDKNDRLEPGEIIYLKKKQKKADKVYRNRPHRVKEGESMYSIAQNYGIRLSSLYKMNKLGPDYSIKVGDYLRVIVLQNGLVQDISGKETCLSPFRPDFRNNLLPCLRSTLKIQKDHLRSLSCKILHDSRAEDTAGSRHYGNLTPDIEKIPVHIPVIYCISCLYAVFLHYCARTQTHKNR